ncbi:hypothetical protein GW796_05765 [archaeon]|nr:hypothetical protein [archaeon]NCQ51391.1 hypothetical protein [archaeon]NCT58783.1 hypothetical protein [archaeon]
MGRFLQIFNLILEKEIKGKSIFNMDDVDKIIKMTIEDGKKYIKQKLDAANNLTPQTKSKVIGVINTATTPTKLGISVSNFILAHPKEGLKTFKIGDK